MNTPDPRFQIAAQQAGLLDPRKSETTTIDLSRVLQSLRRRRWAIFLSIFLWMALGLFYALTTPRFYDATSQVMLDSNISRTLEQVSSAGDTSITDSVMESARLVISSQAIAGRVVDRLQLQDNDSFVNPPISLTAELLGRAFGYIRLPMVWLRQQMEPMTDLDLTGAPESLESQQSADMDPALVEAMQREQVVSALQDTVAVYRIGRSSAFGITHRSTDPVLAAQIVNTFADVYVSDALNSNFEAIEGMTSWMQERLIVLESEARVAAREAEAFRAANGLVQNNNSSMSQDAVVMLNSDLSDAISNAAQAGARVVALQAVVDQGVEALIDDGIPAGLPPISDPDFQEYQSGLTNIIGTLNRARASNAAAQAIATWELRAREAADRLFTLIKVQLEQARGEASLQEARVNALRASVNDAVGVNVEQGDARVELRALEDRAATLSALYQNFLTRFQQIEQQRSLPVSNVRILNIAEVPMIASGPSAKKALAVCLVVGMIMGLIICGILEWRDRFLYTAEQVTGEVGHTFLGYLPELPDTPEKRRWLRRKHGSRFRKTDPIPKSDPQHVDAPPSYALLRPRSYFAEVLRYIRISSQVVGGCEGSKVLGVTSARPNEGKTVTSYELAVSVAAAGYSVILIDGDTHRCGLTSLVQIEEKRGLLEIVSGERHWKERLRILGDTGVHMLPSEVPADFSHAQEILSSEIFSELIADLRDTYDVVLIDLAPLGAVSDVRAVIDEIDKLLLIAQWGKTSKKLLNRLINVDPRIHQKVLGVALSRVDVKRLKDYVDEGDHVLYLKDYSGYYD